MIDCIPVAVRGGPPGQFRPGPPRQRGGLGTPTLGRRARPMRLSARPKHMSSESAGPVGISTD